MNTTSTGKFRKRLSFVGYGALIGITGIVALGLALNYNRYPGPNAAVGTNETIFLPYMDTRYGKSLKLSETSFIPLAHLGQADTWSQLPPDTDATGQSGAYLTFVCRSGWQGKYWELTNVNHTTKTVAATDDPPAP